MYLVLSNKFMELSIIIPNIFICLIKEVNFDIITQPAFYFNTDEIFKQLAPYSEREDFTLNISLRENLYLVHPSYSCHFVSSYQHLNIDSNFSHYITKTLKNGPIKIESSKDIIIGGSIDCGSSVLEIASEGNIIFLENAKIYTDSTVILKAGIKNSDGLGKFYFKSNEPQVIVRNDGKVIIQYNPDKGDEEHKYNNPDSFSSHVAPSEKVSSFMLVNNIRDLQDMFYMLNGHFALSQNIYVQDSTSSKNKPAHFQPITRFFSYNDEQIPFSGIFDGNGYTIKGLLIKYPEFDNVGLFSFCSGSRYENAKISNVIMEDCVMEGDLRVGTICGYAQYTEIDNVVLRNCTIKGNNFVGGIVGSAALSKFNHIMTSNITLKSEAESKGILAGAATESQFIANTDIKEFAKETLVGQDANTNTFCDHD